MSDDDHHFSGEPCPRKDCDGFLHVETSRVFGDHRRRYLKCNKCGHAPENNIQSVPLRFAPPQAPRGKHFSK